MSLVFVQAGLSKSGKLMKYKPEQGSPLGRAVDWTNLYLFAESELNAFARLVLTRTDDVSEAHFIWTSNGTSRNFRKYLAVQTKHFPAGQWAGRSNINQLYIPKDNPLTEFDELYFIANYGGAVEPSLHVITEMPKGEGKTMDIDMPLPPVVRKSNKELRIRKILLEAYKLAKLASVEQTRVVEARKPTSLVDGFTGDYAGSIQDDCGGAWIAGVDGRSQLGRIWKKLAQHADSGFYYGDKRHCGIRASNTQYVSIRKAAADAFVAHVNAELGTELFVSTYID